MDLGISPEIDRVVFTPTGYGPCMSLGRSLYRLHDSDPSKGCHELSGYDEADKWSKQKWGIFWTVNEFSGPRKKENLKRIISFAVDLDGGDKESMREKIRKFITPSAVIESKNGYHVYYDAKPDVSIEAYEAIVGERLVPLLGGDKKAKDVSRILRVPGYCHWKNPDDPFGVKLVQHSDRIYSELDMMTAFPLPKVAEKVSAAKHQLRETLRFQKDGRLAERIASLDCEAALRRISGSVAVNHEMFSFKATGDGKNILVNGKSTSCWVDKSGHIGSLDGGGPTIWQWINWYQRDHKKTYELIKRFFPEIIDESK